jgi:hypothetical protein
MKKVILTFIFLFLLKALALSEDNKFTIEWCNRGGSIGSDWVRKICFDSSGFLYAIGSFENKIKIGNFELTSFGPNDGFIAKLNSKGDYLWVKHIQSKSDIGLFNIECDKTGNLYITGYIKENATIDSLILKKSYGISTPIMIKINKSGKVIWGQSFDFRGNNSSQTSGLTFDVNNNVIVTGYFNVGDIYFNNGISLSTGTDRTGTFIEN